MNSLVRSADEVDPASFLMLEDVAVDKHDINWAVTS